MTDEEQDEIVERLLDEYDIPSTDYETREKAEWEAMEAGIDAKRAVRNFLKWVTNE